MAEAEMAKQLCRINGKRSNKSNGRNKQISKFRNS